MATDSLINAFPRAKGQQLDCVAYSDDVGHAVEAAYVGLHSAGITYGDPAPRNILVDYKPLVIFCVSSAGTLQAIMSVARDPENPMLIICIDAAC